MTALGGKLVLPTSILDTDLYKLTMQQAVLYHYPSVQAKYRFSNRHTNVLFSLQCIDNFRGSIALFTELRLTVLERKWLESNCPWFSDKYLDYLSSFTFNPEQVFITFHPTANGGNIGDVEIEISGPWVECILWEVPLMALLNEIYYQTDSTDWTHNGQEELAFSKGKALFEACCSLKEFGTRRRRSFQTQELVIQGLLRASNQCPIIRGGLSGTSNVHLAHKYELQPVGTIAHEWFMAVGALEGYDCVNKTALRLWEEAYPNNPEMLVALTDTFSSKAFFNDIRCNPQYARKRTGLQQDSGDPFLFAPRVKEVFEELDIDHRDEMILYSDSLNLEKATKIQNQCHELGFKNASFGIGTFLTNDFRTPSSGFKDTSEALVVVIKLSSVGDRPCVKLSDDPTKNSGDDGSIAYVKRVLGLSYTT